jgi:hypothetical protein
MGGESHSQGNRRYLTLRWITRGLTVLIVGFALFFMIGNLINPDPYAVDYPPIENLMPTFLLLSVLSLALAWKWEALGGTLSLIFFAANLGAFWIIRGSFFPLSTLIPLLPIPLTAGFYILLGTRQKLRAEMKNIEHSA